MELCQVSREVASYAINKWKSMDSASEMLLEPAIRQKVEKEVKVGIPLRIVIKCRDS